jgi:uncharacterized membrane protein
MESVELIITVFPEPAKAGLVMNEVQAEVKAGKLRVFSSAWIAKDSDGYTTIKEGQDVDARSGALFGALVGGLIGLLGGPAGAVIGAAAGAATGGVAASRVDLGFENPFLEEVQSTLKPSTSALLLMMENPWGDVVSKALEAEGGKVLRHALRDELATRLHEE